MDFYRIYEREVADAQKLQKELPAILENINQYEQKKHENEMVKAEVEFADENDKIYKLVGPVLVEQNIAEAKLNVNKRIEFITAEINKFSKLYKEKNAQIEQKKKNIQDLQAKIMTISKQLQQKS